MLDTFNLFGMNFGCHFPLNFNQKKVNVLSPNQKIKKIKKKLFFELTDTCPLTKNFKADAKMT